jgi:hypothetical protein
MRILTLALGLIAVNLHAQSKPQFTWEGEVDGIVVLHINGKKLDIECRQGLPVQRQAFKFNSTLPDSRQDVRLEVREGRGGVLITEQPRIENSYTASVTIEDRQDGASYYSIALHWEADRGSFSNEPDRAVGRMDHVEWSGHVDGDVIVECRESRCESKVQRGQPVTREKSKFSRPMAAEEMRVFLDRDDGPADFRLLEEPSSNNAYTAKVRIQAMPGGGDCSFILSWPRPRNKKR